MEFRYCISLPSRFFRLQRFWSGIIAALARKSFLQPTADYFTFSYNKVSYHLTALRRSAPADPFLGRNSMY